MFVAFRLITSPVDAIAGIDFEFTCLNYKYSTFIEISRDNEIQCIAHVKDYEDCLVFHHNLNYSCICKDGRLTLTINGTFDINMLHGSVWTCRLSFPGEVSNRVMLYVNSK